MNLLQRASAILSSLRRELDPNAIVPGSLFAQHLLREYNVTPEEFSGWSYRAREIITVEWANAFGFRVTGQRP